MQTPVRLRFLDFARNDKQWSYDNPWRCEQYTKREETLTEFTLT